MAVSIKDSKIIYKMLADVFSKIFGKNINYKEANTKSISQWDSIRGVQLLLAVEDKFNLKFSFKEVEKFDSFEKIYNILIKKMSKKLNR